MIAFIVNVVYLVTYKLTDNFHNYLQGRAKKKVVKLRVKGCIVADRQAAAGLDFLAEMRREYSNRGPFSYNYLHKSIVVNAKSIEVKAWLLTNTSLGRGKKYHFNLTATLCVIVCRQVVHHRSFIR